MSDTKNNNSLSKNQQEKALKWLNEKWKKDASCEVCGEKNWQLVGDMVSPLIMSGNNINLGGNSYPSVSLVCKNCANTKYFNAVVMGLVGGEKKEEEKNDK
jgi:hypothetical protein